MTETVASPTDGSSISSGGGFSNLFARPSYQVLPSSLPPSLPPSLPLPLILLFIIFFSSAPLVLPFDVILFFLFKDRVVSSFLATLSGALKSQFNTSGRGYPGEAKEKKKKRREEGGREGEERKSYLLLHSDISALGHNIPAYYNGNISRFDGTSASTPFVAGLVTLLNDIRLSQGKPPLGFINPLLYSLNSSFFNGIVTLLPLSSSPPFSPPLTLV